MDFYCEVCDLKFQSGYGLADHFRSEEHRDKADGGNLESVIDSFLGHVKKSIASDPDKKN